MRVLLISPDVGFIFSASTVSMPLGILSISTYLKTIGHEVQIFDRNINKQQLSLIVSEFKPDLVGVSLMSNLGIPDAVEVSKQIRSQKIPVIWGGAAASVIPELILQENVADYVIIGEGEYTFREIIEIYEKGRSAETVLGIAYRRAGTYCRNEDRPFIDLSLLPQLDFELIDVEKYLIPYENSKKFTYLYSSKGCPCRCAFCNNACFHKSTHRKKPNEIVIKEIKYLIDNYGLDGVSFSDELWVTKRSDMLDFCRRVKENDLHFYWYIMTRIGVFDKEDFELMYECGCRGVLFGIETGSESMLKKIHKSINCEQIVPYFESIKEVPINYSASFIVGFPSETPQEVKETVQLILSLDCVMIQVYHFTPFPGTESYLELVAQGKMIPPRSLSELAQSATITAIDKNYSQIPSKDLKIIRNAIIWRTAFKKSTSKNKQNFTFAKNTIVSVLKSITQKGIVYFVKEGFQAAYEFMIMFWYSHAYPKTRKKYGL